MCCRESQTAVLVGSPAEAVVFAAGFSASIQFYVTWHWKLPSHTLKVWSSWRRLVVWTFNFCVHLIEQEVYFQQVTAFCVAAKNHCDIILWFLYCIFVFIVLKETFHFSNIYWFKSFVFIRPVSCRSVLMKGLQAVWISQTRADHIVPACGIQELSAGIKVLSVLL